MNLTCEMPGHKLCAELVQDERMLWLKLAEGRRDRWLSAELQRMKELLKVEDPADPQERALEKLIDQTPVAMVGQLLLLLQGHAVYVGFLIEATPEQRNQLAGLLIERLQAVAAAPDPAADWANVENEYIDPLNEYTSPLRYEDFCWREIFDWRDEYLGEQIPVEDLVDRARGCGLWLGMMLFACRYSWRDALQQLAECDRGDKYRRKMIAEARDYVRRGHGFVERDGLKIPRPWLVRGEDRYTDAIRDVRTFSQYDEYDPTQHTAFMHDPPLTADELAQVKEIALGTLPEIVTSNQAVRHIRQQAVDAISRQNLPRDLFMHSSKLARVVRDERGSPFLSQLETDAVAARMTETANYVSERITANGLTRRQVAPPVNVARQIRTLTPREMPFPPLEGILETPVVRPDGTVLSAPGYDPQTRLFLASKVSVPNIPDQPTRRDAIEAAEFIDRECFADFPFASTGDRAAAFAAVLTPILRPAISGCVPIILINAPTPGTGKGLLASVISLVSTGRHGARATAPDNEEEWRKRITSLLMAGATVVVLDNIEQPLNSSSLASLLTSEEWEDRALGRNELVRLPNRSTWLGTGNNITLRGDLPRRCVWCQLDARTARPWSRSGFRHPDLTRWVADHRADIITAALTMARAWFAADRPAANVKRLGSFENWCEVIGGILAFAGVAGFLANFDVNLDEADHEASGWEYLLTLMHQTFGDRPFRTENLMDDVLTRDRLMGPNEEEQAVARGDSEEEIEVRRHIQKAALPSAVVNALYATPEKAASNRVGHLLRKKINCHYGHLVLRRIQDDPTYKVARYQVEVVRG